MEQLRTHPSGDQYGSAFATIRAAKNWFWWLILAAIVVQIACFVLVRFAGVIDEAPGVMVVGQAKPAAGANEAVGAQSWYNLLLWLLPATKFVALAAGMLLILTLMFSVKLSLLGRTGGVAAFMSAFFWSILLWVFLIPWQQVVKASFACGALYNLTDLVDQTRAVVWNDKDVSIVRGILYYVRFVVYPLFVVLLQLLVQAKFARGYRRMTLAVAESGSGQTPQPDENI